MITALDQLSPATRRAVEEWLDETLTGLDAELRASLRDMYETELCDRLDANSTPADVAAATADLRPEGDGAGARDWRTGVLFGIPYDVRTPTGARLRDSLWNPAEPRLFVPRAFGAGWDLNFGALAVKAGLIEPDAEDEPFTSTPHEAYVLAAAVPTLLASAVVAHYVVRGRSLPKRLPSHWGLDGRPDAWISKGAAAALDVTVATAGAGLGSIAAASRLYGAGRAMRMAVATTLAGGAAGLTVARSVEKGGAWVGPLVVGSLVGPVGVVLVGLALAGRDAEQKRDLR